MQPLLDLLGVPSAVWPRVRLMLLCSSFYGVTRATYLAAANAFFVIAFGSKGYPWTYLAAAVVVPALGLSLRTLQKKLSFRGYLSLLLLVLLVPVVIFRAALWWSTAPALIFALLLFNEVIFAFGSAAYWGLAGRMFDVREAKRVFGLIGSGEVAATIVAAALLPLAINLVGTANLLWLAAAGIAGCWWCVQLAARQFPSRLSSEPRDEGGAFVVASAPSGRRRSYVWMIFSVSVLNTFVFYLADMLFYTSIETRFTSADEVGRFLGVFLAVAGIATLLVRLASGRILTWVGVGAGVIAEPLVVGSLALVVTLSGQGAEWLFYGVVGLKLAERLSLDAFTKPSMQVLYQPLPPDERLRAQEWSSTVVDQIAGGVIGALLLLSLVVGDLHARSLAAALLAVCIVWFVLGGAARRGYKRALSSALAVRFLGHSRSATLDRDARQTLLGAVSQAQPSEALAALDLLCAQGASWLTEEAVSAALSHEAADVRAAGLRIVGIENLFALSERVVAMAGSDEDHEVRACAVAAARAVGALDDGELEDLASRPEAPVRAAALAALLRTDAHQPFARPILDDLVGSKTGEDLAQSVRILRDGGQPGLWPLLQTLLVDEDDPGRASASLTEEPPKGERRVQVAAIVLPAVGALAAAGHAGALAALAESLADDRLRHAATAALAGAGPAALSTAESVARDGGRAAPTRRAALRAIARNSSPEVDERLLSMAREDVTLRRRALEQLSARGRALHAGQASEDLVKLAAEDLERATLLEAFRQTLGVDRGEALAADPPAKEEERSAARLAAALEAEIHEAVDAALLAMALSRPGSGLEQARSALASEAVEMRGFALELIEEVLGSVSAQRLVALIERRPDPDAVGDQPALAEAVWRLDASLDSWTRKVMIDWGRRTHSDAGWVVKTLAAEPKEGEPAAGRAALHARVDALMGAAPFRSTAPRLLAELASRSQERILAAGDDLVQKGAAGDSMFLIVSGGAEVQGPEGPLASLGAGELLGELSLLDGGARSATVTATEPTVVIEVTQAAFLDTLRAEPSLAIGIARVLSRRLRETS